WGRRRGAVIIFRTRPVFGSTGPHALFCQRADDAVCAAALHRHSRRPRFRHCKELSSPRRSDEPTGGSGLTCRIAGDKRTTGSSSNLVWEDVMAVDTLAPGQRQPANRFLE